MFEEITRVNLLYDFYGNLLTKRQREVMYLYHEENYSLSEIADEFQISRQGVHDALKNAEKSLNDYEEKLGLVDRFDKTEKVINEIDNTIDKIVKEDIDKNIKEKLLNIKTMIDGINE
ncbi:MAG: YlxM family DNA-binding protein [Eubacterium sp.]|nr:YlxM family DNA-binding protein [Eubacterium sp.]